MKAALISLVHIPSWCSLSPGLKPAQFWCQEEKRAKREYSTARGRWDDNESGLGERYHSVQSSKLFVSWLIKIQEALRVKLFNQLCIYDAPLSLSLWYLCSSALESQDLSLNTLPRSYSSILFLSSIPVSLGSHSARGDRGIGCSAPAIMDYMILSDPWPQVRSLKRHYKESTPRCEINDEGRFTVHLKR